MSALLEQLVDAQRRADCARNELAVAAGSMRECTRYLTLSFGAEMADEIAVEARYYFTPSTPDNAAEVELCEVIARHVDMITVLPEPLRRKLEADILKDETTGVFA